jgi:hypothetical protein
VTEGTTDRRTFAIEQLQARLHCSNLSVDTEHTNKFTRNTTTPMLTIAVNICTRLYAREVRTRIIIICFTSQCNISRSQWPSGLGHELFSPAPTLRSWVQIPLRHGCLCVLCAFFLFLQSQVKQPADLIKG